MGNGTGAVVTGDAFGATVITDPVSSDVLGVAIADALGVPSKMVTSMTIRLDAGKDAEINVSFLIDAAQSLEIVEVFKKYQVLEK